MEKQKEAPIVTPAAKKAPKKRGKKKPASNPEIVPVAAAPPKMGRAAAKEKKSLPKGVQVVSHPHVRDMLTAMHPHLADCERNKAQRLEASRKFINKLPAVRGGAPPPSVLAFAKSSEMWSDSTEPWDVPDPEDADDGDIYGDWGTDKAFNRIVDAYRAPWTEAGRKLAAADRGETSHDEPDAAKNGASKTNMTPYIKGGKLVDNDITEHLLMTDYGFMASNLSEAFKLINGYLAGGDPLSLAIQAASLYLNGWRDPGDAEKIAKHIMKYGTEAMPASFIPVTAQNCHNGIFDFDPIVTENGPGIRLQGRQMVCGFGSTDTTSDGFIQFAGGSTLPAASSKVARIGVDILNGQIAGEARWWSRWLPMSLEFDYAPAVGTSVSGACALAVNRDAAYNESGLTTTFAGVLQTGGEGQCTLIAPYQHASVYAHFGNTRADASDYLWTTDDGGSGEKAGDRLSNACCLLSCHPTIVTSGTLLWGYIMLTYDIILAGPTQDRNFSVFLQARRLMGSFAYNQFCQLLDNPDVLFKVADQMGVAGGILVEDEEVGKTVAVLRAMGIVPPKGADPKYVEYLREQHPDREGKYIQKVANTFKVIRANGK